MKPSTFLECSQSMRRGRASTLIETVLETLIRTRTGGVGGEAAGRARDGGKTFAAVFVLNEGTD